MQHYLSLTLLLSTLSLAKPIGRPIVDLYHNGIPDRCAYKPGWAECLEHDRWTSVPLTTSTLVSTAAGWSAVVPHTSIPAAVVSAPAWSLSTVLQSTPPSAWSSSPQATVPPLILSSSTTSGQILTSTSGLTQPTGSLPSPAEFNTQNGTSWSIEYVGDIGFTGSMQNQGLVGDKCRSSTLGGQVIWNCGDMECSTGYSGTGQADWEVCGFNMGPTFYGTDSVMTINTNNITNINSNTFLQPWSGDPVPEAPQSSFGMDTSNVAAINDTHGVAYAWEIWRGASDGSISNRGNAVAAITHGETIPVATRIGPLLTGPDNIQLGLNGIINAEGYIYIYSAGGPTKMMVTRVPADDSVFDATKYESLTLNQTWVNGIAQNTDNMYGMQSSDTQFACGTYGSAFYSNYFNQYVLICNIFELFTHMYVSDTPYGPFTGPYELLSGVDGYGSMAHPSYSPGGSHKELYFSQGPNSKFNMFKVTFA